MKTIVATFTFSDGRCVQATGCFESCDGEGRVIWSGQRTPGDELFPNSLAANAEPPDRVEASNFETLMQICAEMFGALLVLRASGHWTTRTP